MKILLYGKNAQSIRSTAEQLGFDIVSEKPDLVISYGGDGTLLASEHKYPTIPKLPMRDSAVCKKCSNHTEELLLQKLRDNELPQITVNKLSATVFEETLIALNDIVIRNTSPIHAIRFEITINGRRTPDTLLIGDGIVAATPFGSTAYYHSITRQQFSDGFRIGFNNTVQELTPLSFSASDEIMVKIIRGPAILSSDNSHEFIDLTESDLVTIKASTEQTTILEPDSLRCPNCIVSREKRLHTE